MQSLSEKHIRLIQLVNLLVLIMMLLISISFWVFKGAIVIGLKVLLIGVIFWGPIFLLYLKLFEVRILEDKILIVNLFRQHHFKKTEFEEIRPAFLPLVYKISFKGSKDYFFLIPIENVFTVLFNNRAQVAEKMKLLIKQH